MLVGPLPHIAIGWDGREKDFQRGEGRLTSISLGKFESADYGAKPSHKSFWMTESYILIPAQLSLRFITSGIFSANALLSLFFSADAAKPSFRVIHFCGILFPFLRLRFCVSANWSTWTNSWVRIHVNPFGKIIIIFLRIYSHEMFLADLFPQNFRTIVSHESFPTYCPPSST